jgi:hypothetical protein
LDCGLADTLCEYVFLVAFSSYMMLTV